MYNTHQIVGVDRVAKDKQDDEDPEDRSADDHARK